MQPLHETDVEWSNRHVYRMKVTAGRARIANYFEIVCSSMWAASTDPSRAAC
jgi:hypothetical protein